MKKENLKSLVKKVCEQINSEGHYIKTSIVKFDLFIKYRRKISVSYCQRLLSRLDDENFLQIESRNMSNENIYLYKGGQDE
jgi:ribosomal protein S25